MSRADDIASTTSVVDELARRVDACWQNVTSSSLLAIAETGEELRRRDPGATSTWGRYDEEALDRKPLADLLNCVEDCIGLWRHSPQFEPDELVWYRRQMLVEIVELAQELGKRATS